MELKTDGLLERTKNLVSTFESVNSVDNESSSSSLSSPSPLSPLMVFKAGTLLYETSSSSSSSNSNSNSNSNNNNNNQNKTSYELLAKAFHELLSSSNPDYLTHIIFRDIHTAFLSICNKYITTNNNGTGSSSSNSNGNSNSNDSQTLLTSIGAMCGIYDALSIQYQKNSNTCVMQHAFDVPLCNTLAKLYDYLLQHDDSTSTNANANTSTVQEIKDCTLSILSSQLLYGLIYPTTTCSTTTTTTTSAKSSGEDDTIIQIMQVIQGLTEQQSSSSKVSYCLGDLQLWQRQVQQQQQQQQQQSQQSQQSTNLVSHHKPIVQVIQSIFSNDNEEYYAQKEYLISVLELAPQYDATQKEQTKLYNEQQQKQQQQNQTNKLKNKNNTNSNKKQSAIDRLIQQVYTILPHLGKGYIEAALACYNHNIEQTTNALMEGEFDVTTLHPRLRVLDKNLPARRKETKERYDLDINNIEFGGTNGNGNEMEMDREMKQEKEAKEIQKAKIKEMVQAQEDEAYKLQMVLQTMDLGDDSDNSDDNDNNNNDDIHANIDNDAEYNDDYDDQYDKVADVGGGDTTSGLYDVDFDSIRAYNKVSKEMEADRLFWEGNRNTNVKPKGGVRTGKSSSSRQKKKDSGGGGGGGSGGNDNKHDDDNDDDDDNEGQKQYRGPEKGKGGRIIGPDGRYLPHPKSRKSKGGKKGNNTTPNDTTVSATEKGKSKDGGSGGGGGGKGKDGKGKDGKSKEELTKIQKRRKNDNKSKIGNHHRKERALKKTGM